MVLEKDSERRSGVVTAQSENLPRIFLPSPRARTRRGGGGGSGVRGGGVQIWKQTFINGQDFASSKAIERY